MDDEDIYERFEVTDYDIENEFNFHRARRPTKEQQIYGIWADEEDEYEEKNKNKNDSKGINFVTSKSSSSEDKSKFKSADKDDHFETAARPSFSNTSKLKSKASEDMDQIAGFRTNTSNLRAFDSKFCEFEKNTRGIGSKLLLKMGFQPGKGLGKDLQGISTPIELKPRLGKGAISYYGKESVNGEKFKSEQEPEKKVKSNIDKRSNDRYFDKPKEKKKVNYVYLSEEDLMPKTDTSAFNKLKIIDMTGPEEKVFEGYQELHKTFNKTQFKSNENELKRIFDDENDSSDSDELQQKKLKNQLDYERDRLESLCNERVKYQKEIEFYEQKKQSLELIIDKVTALNSSINELEEIINVCKELNDIELICEVFYLFGFSALKHDLRNWLPFDEPTKHLDNFRTLYNFFSKKRQFYDQIVWHCWVPYVRMSIETFNDMRESAKMIAFFDEWNDLISKWIIDILINQTVVSKLEQQVIDWNPLKDRVLIHLWIHPWLPKIRAQELDIILTPIRKKFANTFKLWRPFDDTVIIVLKPWQHVFGSKNWTEFLKESIIPKLEQMMSNQFIINPKKQDMEAWDKLFAWKDILPERELILILKKYFFPKWLKVLFNWLDSEPNFKEVLDWYLGWKSKFSEEWFNKELVVCQGFTVALRMIEFCIETNGKMASFEFN